ncbi:MAG: hypothetical protein IJ134_05520 [Bacilli bacterium]|nr:hypothetical protein [Bacilli bacterium]
MNKNIKNSLMLIQVITLFAILVFAIISAYSRPFLLALQELVLLELLILIVNNTFIYKKKYMTICYILAFILILVSIINA